MNAAMWEKHAVARNCDQLRKDGILLVGPGEGWLSCRTRGMGRMAEVEEIREAILKQLAPVNSQQP
jgi:phosphopantothenoylcysteine decarboxylase/phosphopantothenate--cysteine ligase